MTKDDNFNFNGFIDPIANPSTNMVLNNYVEVGCPITANPAFNLPASYVPPDPSSFTHHEDYLKDGDGNTKFFDYFYNHNNASLDIAELSDFDFSADPDTVLKHLRSKYDLRAPVVHLTRKNGLMHSVFISIPNGALCESRSSNDSEEDFLRMVLKRCVAHARLYIESHAKVIKLVAEWKAYEASKKPTQ